MKITHDYIPSDAAQFRSFMLNLLRYTEEKSQEWDIPSEALEILSGLYADFIQAFNTAAASPGSLTMIAQKKAQIKVTESLEIFIDYFLQSQPLTDFDRVQMSIQ